MKFSGISVNPIFFFDLGTPDIFVLNGMFYPICPWTDWFLLISIVVLFGLPSKAFKLEGKNN